jgi:OOP family OmpA-OmpF porin
MFGLDYDTKYFHILDMHLSMKILSMILLIFIISCSASYNKLSKTSVKPPNNLSKYLFEAYKNKADFEAKKMHDWNSANLYSEKALKALIGEEIMPQKISYWNIRNDKKQELLKGYFNLKIIYKKAISKNPFNLAKAISSFDCWAEQEEEVWQTWDIIKCRKDFFDSMDNIYKSIEEKYGEDNYEIKLNQIEKSKSTQVIYFDFDKTDLANINIDKIKIFILENKNIIDKFLITGHTDTVGSDKYNHILSINRANAIKNIILSLGVENKNIEILGRGENQLNIETEDEIDQPANRRAEISPLN